LVEEKLSETQKKYFDKLYEKKSLWARCYNKEQSLNSHCTGLVENINKHLKQHVGLKCTLVEYLYRTLRFTTEFNQSEAFSNEDLLTYNAYYNTLKSSPFILESQTMMSEFALKSLMLTLIKSLSWSSFPGKPFEVVKSKGDYQKRLQ